LYWTLQAFALHALIHIILVDVSAFNPQGIAMAWMKHMLWAGGQTFGWK